MALALFFFVHGSKEHGVVRQTRYNFVQGSRIDVTPISKGERAGGRVGLQPPLPPPPAAEITIQYNTLLTTPHGGFSVTMQFKRGNNSK